ncbi:uncharacterized protein LOC119319519 isoform X2 [Triticum dicoccoides]|uniref:uncharacterized protein LOC119319519 isoform X2 n=1 Tax=Triticum dicoccoides TaxID=85692 RepID=UPI001891677D|nr:uncharacterized protein LOC119319519 isoform X2 [Triticum dicoccoides]
MSRPASIYPAVLVEDVVPPSLKADVLAMVMGAAWAVAIDGRLRATVTAGRETVSARKTEAERSLCAGVCSGGVERSCSRRIAKGWRPPSPSQSPIICGLVDEDGVKDGCSTPGMFDASIQNLCRCVPTSTVYMRSAVEGQYGSGNEVHRRW